MSLARVRAVGAGVSACAMGPTVLAAVSLLSWTSGNLAVGTGVGLVS